MGRLLLTDRSVEGEDEAGVEQVLRRREARKGRTHIRLGEKPPTGPRNRQRGIPA
jgi:hypothetical protein